MLIVCGSSVHMMHDVALSHASPLYGRRTAQMRLLPLRFNELRSSLDHLDFGQLVSLYALTGGVPKYLELLMDNSDLGQGIERHVLSTSGFLYEEPKFLLEQDIRDPVNYLSILTALARGNRKPSEMARVLERSSSELSPYLKVLVDLGYVERRVPFNVASPERSKQGLYFVADSFIDFWFRYVQPFASELELGNMQPSREKLAKTFEQSFVPFVFEQVSKEAFVDLCNAGSIPFSPSRVGSYWSRNGATELDVCARDNANDARFLGECKYFGSRPVGYQVYEDLKRKAEAVPAHGGERTMLGLFSSTGFDEALVEKSRRADDLVLVNRNEVVL